VVSLPIIGISNKKSNIVYFRFTKIGSNPDGAVSKYKHEITFAPHNTCE